MKIQKTQTKSEVKACEDCASVATVDAIPYEPTHKDIAVEHIQSAVSALSSWALEHPDDTVVTDSIANLGVVLLDLKSVE